MPKTAENTQTAETMRKWNALREKSPMKAYSILASAIVSTGAEETQIAAQALGDAVSRKTKYVSNSIKEVRDNIGKTYDEFANFFCLSDRFLNKTDSWFEDDK
jgi:hypothetical protein